VVYQPVFWGIVLSFQSPEQGLLGPENLDSTRGVLGKVGETASMANEPGAYKLPDENGQIGCDSVHAIPKIFGELTSILCDRYHLVAEVPDVVNVLFRNLTPHTYFCGDFKCRFQVFGKDGRK
jgi:hypothetical protein